jgi:hypothetical protein
MIEPQPISIQQWAEDYIDLPSHDFIYAPERPNNYWSQMVDLIMRRTVLPEILVVDIEAARTKLPFPTFVFPPEDVVRHMLHRWNYSTISEAWLNYPPLSWSRKRRLKWIRRQRKQSN